MAWRKKEPTPRAITRIVFLAKKVAVQGSVGLSDLSLLRRGKGGRHLSSSSRSGRVAAEGKGVRPKAWTKLISRLESISLEMRQGETTKKKKED